MKIRTVFSTIRIGDAFKLKSNGVIYIKSSRDTAWKLTGKRYVKRRMAVDPNRIVDQIVGKVIDVVLEL